MEKKFLWVAVATWLGVLTTVISSCTTNRVDLVKNGVLTLEKQAAEKVYIAWSNAYKQAGGLLKSHLCSQADHGPGAESEAFQRSFPSRSSAGLVRASGMPQRHRDVTGLSSNQAQNSSIRCSNTLYFSRSFDIVAESSRWSATRESGHQVNQYVHVGDST